MKYLLLFTFCFTISTAFTQDHDAKRITDKNKNCSVFLKHTFNEDSISWNGPCKNGLAEGKGSMLGYTEGKETMKYIGEMKNGWFHGQGTFSFWGDRKLEGNFSEGEPLFLNSTLLKKLKKEIIATVDSQRIYDGDNNKQSVYYNALIPETKINGVIVLLPGTWETTEHLLSSMKAFIELAYSKNYAVLVPSINQHLTLTPAILTIMNTMFRHAITTYNLPKDKFVLGGWSMGGIFSMRYAEYAQEDASKTVVIPKAIFNCDGPCDLASVYQNFKRKLNKNPGQNEPQYGIKELETYCGGSPNQVPDQYRLYSPYVVAGDEGGNAKFLLQTPIRIYGDVDPIWWMQNRHVDMYDMNAINQTAMIQWLLDHGHKQAEFINAYQKGIRLEGNRHPHSWSIVEPNDCMQWIEKCLK